MRDPPDRQGPVLGMCERARALFWREAAEHRDIEAAQHGVSVEGGARLGGFVERQPVVLREWLRDVTLLTERESNARWKRELGLRQVNEDFADAPFAGGVGPLEIRFAPAFDGRANSRRGVAQRLQRIAGFQIGSIGIWRRSHLLHNRASLD